MIASPDALIRIRVQRMDDSTVGARQRELPSIVRRQSHIIRGRAMVRILQTD